MVDGVLECFEGAADVDRRGWLVGLQEESQ
jgi:hypothetical protein